MQRYALFLLRFRYAAAVVLAALFALSAAALPRVELDLSIIQLLEASEAERREVERLNEILPPQLFTLIAVVEWPEPIGDDELAQLIELKRKLETRPRVTEVLTLPTAPAIAGGGPIPRVVPFSQYRPEAPIAERVEAQPLLRGRMLSRDGRASPVLIATDVQEQPKSRMKVTRELMAFVRERAPPGTRLHLIGGDVIQSRMDHYIKQDLMKSVGLEAIFFLILLPLMFRTVRGMAIPLASVAMAVVYNFGLMALFGIPISALGVAIPALIVVIALCDAIHMLHRFEEAMLGGADRRPAILEMMRNVGRACFYTSFTTSIGFFSLVVAPHAAVREFALTATMGVLVAFGVVVTAMPIMLWFWPIGEGHRDWMTSLSRMTYGRGRLTTALFVLFALVSIFGARRIVVDSSWLGELPDGDFAVRDVRWFERNFGGLLSLEATVRGDLTDPKAFRALEALQARMIEQPGITGVESYTHWVRALAGNPETPSDEEIRRGFDFLQLAGDRFPRHVITPDLAQGRIVFFTYDVGIKRYLELQALLEREAAKIGEVLQVAPGGYSRMAYESSQLVVTTMLGSLALSLAAITLFIMIGYRSVRLGLIAFIPNCLPILAAIGATGWLGIPLRIGIVVAYCVGVGLAVDDTIHLLTRFVQERIAHPRATTRQIMHRALRSTGKALVITSIVLTLGALSYLSASFKSIRDVGFLLSVVIVTALATDIFLLPVLVERFYPKRGSEK